MNKNILLKAGYKRFQQMYNDSTLYQKKVTDGDGVKYFINCNHYTFPERSPIKDGWEFSIQLDSTFGTINIKLFNKDKISLMAMETFMECEWINHGAKYYELFAVEKETEQ